MKEGVAAEILSAARLPPCTWVLQSDGISRFSPVYPGSSGPADSKGRTGGEKVHIPYKRGHTIQISPRCTKAEFWFQVKHIAGTKF